MRIQHIKIENYKSLQSIEFSPEALTVIAGSNGSGKSNLTDCLDFLSIAYRFGLEIAVASKGGYENIAHRKMRRTKKPIELTVIVELDRSDFQRPFLPPADNFITITHKFSFLAKGASIRAEFAVSSEEVFVNHRHGSEPEELLLNAKRNNDTIEIVHVKRRTSTPKQAAHLEDRYRDVTGINYFATFSEAGLNSSELFVTALSRLVPLISTFTRRMGEIRVFQIHPNVSRDDGVPGPRPELSKHGGNLPAVIDSLSKKHSRVWQEIVVLMRSILPNLVTIEVNYTPSRRLGLSFHEAGVGRPWTVDEISDGTIQSLALLVAMFDPAASTVIVEEPENSVHPWIVRQLIDACRQVSRRKQVVVTTHSPVVIDHVKPSEMLVMWRSSVKSELAPLAQLDPEFVAAWENGEVSTFGFLDSGVLKQGVPPSPLLILDSE